MKRFILVVVCSLLPLANGFYDAQDSGDLAEDGPEPKLREQIQACSNKWLKEHRRGYQFINYMTKGLKEQLASGRRSALPATPLAPAIFPLPRLSHDARTGRGNHAGGETKAKERALTAGPHAGVERSIDASSNNPCSPNSRARWIPVSNSFDGTMNDSSSPSCRPCSLCSLDARLNGK